MKTLGQPGTRDLVLSSRVSITTLAKAITFYTQNGIRFSSRSSILSAVLEDFVQLLVELKQLPQTELTPIEAFNIVSQVFPDASQHATSRLKSVLADIKKDDTTIKDALTSLQEPPQNSETSEDFLEDINRKD